MSETLDHALFAADPMPGLEFSVFADTVSRGIRLMGELDAETCCLLRSVVEGQIGQHHVHLCLDVADLTFIDLAGFDALRDAQRRLDERGGRLTVVGYDAFFGKLATLCGMQDLLDGS